MLLRGFFFVALAGSHAAVAFFAPAALAPAVAGSVYLPLMPLQAVGAPVFAAAASGGWSSPSLLGWVVVLFVWFAIWWAAAYFLSRLFSKAVWQCLTIFSSEPAFDRPLKSSVGRNHDEASSS